MSTKPPDSAPPTGPALIDRGLEDHAVPLDREALRAIARSHGGGTGLWFAIRAVGALLFLAGFFAMGAALVAATVGFLYFSVVHARRFPGALIAPLAIGSYGFVRACFLSQQPWKDPGPELFERDQPRLFALVREVAARVGAEMPDHLYVTAEVNAFVTQVGGALGVTRGRRMLGIGAPLLAAWSEGEIRSVIAHEFGHFHGGEARLGGILHTVRASCVRVVETIHETLGDSWIAKPFGAYLRVFVRWTAGISRRQELLADAMAVRVAGRAVTASALQRAESEGVLFETYLRAEVEPLVAMGRKPADLHGGFRMFAKHSVAARKLEDGALPLQPKTHPFDTHPPLSERLMLIEECEEPAVALESGPAGELLTDPGAIERAASDALFDSLGNPTPLELEPIEWSQVVEAIYGPSMVRDSDGFLASRRGRDDGGIAGLTDALNESDRIGVASGFAPALFRGAPVNASIIAQAVLHRVIAARVGCVLVRQHHAIVSFEPGRAMQFQLPDGTTIEPETLATRVITADDNALQLRQELSALRAPSVVPAETSSAGALE